MIWISRLLNLSLITGSYLFSLITRRVVHSGMPLAVSIEPTNRCNLHCPECPSGKRELTRPSGVMDFALFKSAIDQLTPQLVYLTLYFQGEPYLDSRLFRSIKYAREKKIKVVTSTNGHFLNEHTLKSTLESGLNELIISLDGFDQQSYESYRIGGDFRKVTEGIRLLVNEKRRLNLAHPEIILQCLVLSTNEARLDEIRNLGMQMGVDRVEFKSAQFYDFQEGNLLMPVNSRFSRYRKVKTNSPEGTQQYVLKNKFRNSCFRMWSSCVISWDGRVVPCCFDKDAGHSTGNLKNQTFGEIWRGKKYGEFRKTILTNRKSVDICCNCSEKF